MIQSFLTDIFSEASLREFADSFERGQEREAAWKPTATQRDELVRPLGPNRPLIAEPRERQRE